MIRYLQKVWLFGCLNWIAIPKVTPLFPEPRAARCQRGQPAEGVVRGDVGVGPAVHRLTPALCDARASANVRVCLSEDGIFHAAYKMKWRARRFLLRRSGGRYEIRLEMPQTLQKRACMGNAIRLWGGGAQNSNRIGSYTIGH